tara:strand:+ start:1282 stop:2316 length:1035 start_codon:yes stop_codon:yes gene_type:complete
MNFQEYLKHHYNFFETLVLQITLRCPLECGHCNVNSSPRAKIALSRQSIDRAIRGFADTPDSKMVFITGGEPFAECDLLDCAITISRDLGLATYVITSAHWARSSSGARKVLNKLPKIDLMSISIDEWHLKYVPLEQALRGAKIAAEAGTDVNIALTLRNPDDPFRQIVYEAIEQLEFSPSVYECMVAPVGRSVLNGNHNISKEPAVGYCPKIGAPTITSDGSIIACCNATETNLISQTELANEHGLLLGHVDDTTLSEVKHKLENDPILLALRLLGPGWIWQQGLKYNLFDNLLEAPHSGSSNDICQVCAKLVRNGERVRRLQKIMAKPEVAAQLRWISGRTG